MRRFGAVLGHADGHHRSQASETRLLIKTPDWILERAPREAVFLFVLGDHQKTRNDRASMSPIMLQCMSLLLAHRSTSDFDLECPLLGHS
jgi:hypothetical protein